MCILNQHLGKKEAKITIKEERSRYIVATRFDYFWGIKTLSQNESRVRRKFKEGCKCIKSFLLQFRLGVRNKFCWDIGKPCEQYYDGEDEQLKENGKILEKNPELMLNLKQRFLRNYRKAIVAE